MINRKTEQKTTPMDGYKGTSKCNDLTDSDGQKHMGFIWSQIFECCEIRL